MENLSALRNALCWAAGNDACTFALDRQHEDAFLDAVKAHRLSGRLVRRVQQQPSAVSPELAKAASRLHEDVTADMVKKIQVADRLGLGMRNAGRDAYLILIKGFTLYALTGDPLTMRWSGDVDVSVSDLDGFIDVATREGFTMTGPRDHLAEYAVLESDVDGIVELHSRFDVTGLPVDLTADEVDPRLHDGVWEQRRHFRVHYLTFQDFQRAVGVSHAVPDTIRPLRPEMAALIYAAHMFKNFLRCPYPMPIATIPLDEVASFVDLCRLPIFDTRRFAELVDGCHGHTVVAFARMLTRELLGADPLTGDAGARLFPGNLWWDGLDGGGFPVDVGCDARQLVCRDRPLRDLVDALGSTTIVATGGARNGRALALLGAAATAQPRRCMLRSDGESAIASACTIALDPHGLTFRIGWSGLGDHRMVGISLTLQDYRYEIFPDCTVRPFFTDYSAEPGGEDEAVVTRYTADATDGIEIRLPSRIVDRCAMDGAIDGVLVIREQVKEWSRMTAGAAVPLRIRVAA